MAGATHRELARQKLASGLITERQFRMLEAKYFPPPEPPRHEAPTPVTFRPWELPLMEPVAKPGAERPRPSSDPDPAHAALIDYLSGHPDPHPNHKQPLTQRTAHPGAQSAAPISAAKHPNPPTKVAAQIDQMVNAGR